MMVATFAKHRRWYKGTANRLPVSISQTQALVQGNSKSFFKFRFLQTQALLQGNSKSFFPARQFVKTQLKDHFGTPQPSIFLENCLLVTK